MQLNVHTGVHKLLYLDILSRSEGPSADSVHKTIALSGIVVLQNERITGYVIRAIKGKVFAKPKDSFSASGSLYKPKYHAPHIKNQLSVP